MYVLHHLIDHFSLVTAFSELLASSQEAEYPLDDPKKQIGQQEEE